MGMEWGSLKVERYTLDGLPDATDLSQHEQTSVGKAMYQLHRKN